MATLSSIVHWNTKAIALAQQNSNDEAIKGFRRALACLFRIVGTKKDSNVHHRTTCTAKKMYTGTELMDTSESMQTTIVESVSKVESVSIVEIASIVESISIDHPQSNAETNYLSTSPDNAFQFYNRAFALTSSSIKEEVHDSVMAAILLYNMALAYHSKAMRTCATKELYRALKLYRMSFDVLQDNSKISCDMVNLLLLALINNMGFIHSHIYDWDEMKNSYEVLHSLFMATCDISNNLEAEDCMFFSYVLSPLQISSVAPAA
jgi:tetratricopeptide (TPR) repeat protein